VLINGEQRNSLTAFKGSSGLPIAKTEADTFAHLRDALLAKLNAIGRNTATTLAAVQSTSHSAVPAPH
jgi:hypothetical protein